MLRVKINPGGYKRLRTLAEAIPLSEGDKSGPLLRALDQVHVVQVKRAFQSQGGSVPSGPWPKLSPRYAEWKKRQVGKKKILRFTDTLYEKATSPRHGNHIARYMAPFTFALGFRDDPGFFHQEGGPTLPKRSLVDKGESDLAAFRRALTEFWIKRLRQVLRGRR